MKKIIAAIFITTLFITRSNAQSVLEAPPAVVQGTKIMYDKCGQFLEEERDRSPQYDQYMTWLAGYISGYNSYAPWEKETPLRNIARGSDIPEWSAWLKNYCSTHPFDSFFQATMGLMDQFGALNPKKNRNRWK